MRRVLLVGLVVAAASASPATAATKPLAELLRGETYEMRVDADQVQVRIPVELASNARPRSFTMTTLSVARDNREDKAISDAFVPAMGRRRAGQGDAIELTVAANELQAGTYSVILRLAKIGTKKTQRITLDVVHPAAKLAAVGTVRLDQRDGFFGLGDKTEGKANALTLNETDHKSRMTNVVVKQIGAPTGPRLSNGVVKFEQPGTIAIGEPETVVVESADDFPLGTSTGTFQVYAPQLESTVTGTFEVKRARSPIWIPILVLLGSLTGWALRVWLARAVKRNEAKLEAYQLLAQMDAEIKRRPDRRFKRDVSNLRERLEEQARTTSDGDKLAAWVKTKEGELAVAVKALEDRRDAALAQIAELQGLIELRWLAPPAVLAVLKAQRERLATAQRKLDGYDVEAAEAGIREVSSQLDTELPAAAEEWRAGLEGLLATLKDTTLPPALRPDVQAIAAATRAALDASTLGDSHPQPERILQGIHDAESQYTALTRRELPRLVATLEETVRLLETPGAPAAVGKLKRAIEALEKSLGRGPSDVAKALKAVKGPLKDAFAATTSTQLRTKVERLTKAGSYVEAAEAIAAARATAKTGGEVERDWAQEGALRDVARSQVAAGAFAAAPASQQLSIARVITNSLRRFDPLPGLKGERFLATLGLVQAKFVRSLLVGMVIAAATYVVFSGMFDGTAEQMIGLFLYGLTIDFGVQTAFDLAGAGKLAPPATTQGTPTAGD